MNILKSSSASAMTNLGVRQLVMLLLSTLMILTGLLRPAGELSTGTILFTWLLVISVFMSFSADRLSATLW